MEFGVSKTRSSSSSSEEGPAGGRDWEALAAALSPAALEALRALDEDKAESTAPSEGKEGKYAPSDKMSNSEFKKMEYWDQRFGEEQSYDWLCTYDRVKEHVLHLIKPSDTILVVGCGNSSFSSDLYDDGFHNIVNIDYSRRVVLSMAEKNSDRPMMRWIEMDMLELSFEASTFDVVIDKAAMDAIMVDEGDVWDPAQGCVEAAHKMCVGIGRVLKDRGTYLQISFAQPHFRTKYLRGDRYKKGLIDHYSSACGFSDLYRWDVGFNAIEPEGGGCINSFLYIMNKKG